MKVILPASGFGKRNPGETVKELMIRDGHPLIEFSFSHLLETTARNLVKEIVIITRKEKVNSFREWLKDFRPRHDFRTEVEFLIHEPIEGQEWPMTLLASERHWASRNLVLLPDTKLTYGVGQAVNVSAGGSSSIKRALASGMQGLVAEFDRRLANQRTVWGIVRRDFAAAKTYGVVDPVALTVTEKPQLPGGGRSPTTHFDDSKPFWVWGCFGFQRQAGRELLLNLESSTHTHEPFVLPSPSSTIELDEFIDLSR